MIWRVSDDDLEALGQVIVANSAGAVSGHIVANGELTVTTTAHHLIDVLTNLRDNPDFQFQQLIDLCGADYPQRALRFDVVYHLLSMTKNQIGRAHV